MKNDKCVEIFLRLTKISDRLPKHIIKEKKNLKQNLIAARTKF